MAQPGGLMLGFAVQACVYSNSICSAGCVRRRVGGLHRAGDADGQRRA